MLVADSVVLRFVIEVVNPATELLRLVCTAAFAATVEFVVDSVVLRFDRDKLNDVLS